VNDSYQFSPASVPPVTPRVRATLRDVADRAGLSLGTVSRILNGGNKGVWVSTASREKVVRQIAVELGYSPSFRGRSLRKQKSHCIALVCGLASPMLHGVYEALAGSVASVLEADGYHLLFLPLPPESMDEWPLDLLRNGRVDGCIAMDPLPDVVAVALQECGLPFVAVNVDRDVPCVRPEDAGGMEAAVECLAGHGHRRIAFYVGEHPEGAHFSLAVRLQAYERTMARLDLESHCETYRDSVEEFVSTWTARASSHRATAVIIYQGLQALPLHQQLLAAGVRIPDEISLVSFDDLPSMQWLTPAMTCIDVPIADMGGRAASMLINRLERGQALPTSPQMFPERLVLRQSVRQLDAAER
jgi:LacI family transcriptional regulator